ncbi:MAG: Ig-like domain-containing protein [Planctomycetota bacterium]
MSSSARANLSSTRARSSSKRGRDGSRRRMLLQSLEPRQLLAGDLPLDRGPNNIGDIPAFQYIEQEAVGEFGVNDELFNAETVPLGTGPGQEQAVDISGSASFRVNAPSSPVLTSDLDTYRVDLRQGDVLDIAVQGALGSIDLFYGNGRYFMGTDSNQSSYPIGSPLQTEGNAAMAVVVPETGTYYIQSAPLFNSTTYTIGLRAYRPVAERLPVGGQQIIFIDYREQIINSNEFGFGPTQTRFLRSFGDTLAGLDPTFGTNAGTPNEALINDIQDDILAEVTEMFAEVGEFTGDPALSGNNGDFAVTGNPGEYGVTIIDSRVCDGTPGLCEASFGPTTIRVTVTGTQEDFFDLPINGIAQSVDVGNFRFDDRAITLVDGSVAEASIVPRSGAFSFADVFVRKISSTIAHEIAHSVGIYHTNNENGIASIIDTGGSEIGVFQDGGTGPDGIAGTADDVLTRFRDDFFDPDQGFFGREEVINSLANVLVTGASGDSLAGGRVFSDANGNGIDDLEDGLQGVRVYADLDGDGIFDPTEPSDVTDSNGNYQLLVAPGTYTVRLIAPEGFQPTTATSVIVNSAAQVAPVFGFRQINPDVTGTTFLDEDGNGVFDDDEGRLANVFIYADLDGDDRPDLGEPGVSSDADGEYSLDLPGPGTYVIRAVVPPGFEQTTPDASENFEVIVSFDGTNFDSVADFGFLASQDFGDAPASYDTATASHGILQGLRLGTQIDREGSAAITSDASGDDTTGSDDEDGFQVLTPVAPGAAATLRVTATNDTAQPGYISVFFDANLDGDFTDAGEQIVTDALVPAGSGLDTYDFTINVPGSVALGDSFARVRLSANRGVGPSGFVLAGEIEDHPVQVRESAGLANNDSISVPRNALAFELDVLENDFVTATNGLQITGVQTQFGTSQTNGFVRIANDGQSIFFTPTTGFSGETFFTYSVIDAAGNTDTATVTLQVQFQSLTPIALDDIFTVPENSNNRPLNVLDNDLPSIFGGLSIISVSSGTAGGAVSIVGGGQSLRYTPQPGFNGSEQFLYGIQDSQGNTDTATVTINLAPGVPENDEVAFDFEFLNAFDETPLAGSIRAGEQFKVRVTVDDIAFGRVTQGVASAFLDVLYTDELLNVVTEEVGGTVRPVIDFGPLFSDFVGNGEFANANVSTPGIIDEVGSVQAFGGGGLQSHDGPVELFTITMFAVGPGTAVFAGDPADDPTSETILINEDEVVPFDRQRLGRGELLITPATDNFTAAVDDSFPDGRDSNNNLITVGTSAALDVLDNDQFGETGNLIEFGLVTQPALGSITINDNNTPDNLLDDFFSYQPRPNESGLESFRYVIATADGVRSIASVTFPVGTVETDVSLTFNLVDEAGNDITEVAVGQRFGIEVFGEDTRLGTTQEIFAAYQDVMYSSDLIVPSDQIQNDIFNFDVEFEPAFDLDGNFTGGDPINPDAGDAASGDATVPGIINEFGSFNGDDADLDNPAKIATLFFVAVDGGTAVVVGGPAELFPDNDTLVRGQDDPVPVDRILFDKLTFPVTGSGAQNQLNRFDVNNDGRETPMDALLVLNHIHRSRSSGEGEQGGSGSSPSHYTDVNGDRRTTPLDALQVLNQLRRNSLGSGEGEFASGSAELSADAGTSSIAIDALTVIHTDTSAERVVDEVLSAESSADGLMSFGDEDGLGHVCDAIDMPQIDDADDREPIDEGLLALLSEDQ